MFCKDSKREREKQERKDEKKEVWENLTLLYIGLLFTLL